MKKCFFCNSNKATHDITELKNGKVVESFCVCEKCVLEYAQNTEKLSKNKIIDISEIDTPGQLLSLINKISGKKNKPNKPPCNRCGLTSKEFQIKGRFGCPNCYDHFKEEFETLVAPWHGASEHVGKTPKSRGGQEETLENKIKTLKLKLAKASEVENYELAAVIKKELDALTNPLPEKTSLDQ